MTALHIPTGSNQSEWITLTTEHSASSYGLPVAIINGEVLGPEDFASPDPADPLHWLREPARQTVAYAAHETPFADHELVRAFCSH